MAKEIKNVDGIEVGMYCTYGCWSDRYVAKVVSITAKTFTAKEIRPLRNKAVWPDQDWEMQTEPDANAPEMVVRQSTSHGKRFGWKSGSWRFSKPAKIAEKDLGNLYYRDPSF